MSQPHRRWVAHAGIAVCAAFLALSLGHVGGPLTGVVGLAAVCVVPGAAFVLRCPAGDALTDVALAIGVSLGAATALSAVMIALKAWSPGVAAVAVAVAVLPVFVLELRTRPATDPRRSAR